MKVIIIYNFHWGGGGGKTIFLWEKSLNKSLGNVCSCGFLSYHISVALSSKLLVECSNSKSCLVSSTGDYISCGSVEWVKISQQCSI